MGVACSTIPRNRCRATILRRHSAASMCPARCEPSAAGSVYFRWSGSGRGERLVLVRVDRQQLVQRTTLDDAEDLRLQPDQGQRACCVATVLADLGEHAERCADQELYLGEIDQ